MGQGSQTFLGHFLEPYVKFGPPEYIFLQIHPFTLPTWHNFVISLEFRCHFKSFWFLEDALGLSKSRLKVEEVFLHQNYYRGQPGLNFDAKIAQNKALIKQSLSEHGAKDHV